MWGVWAAVVTGGFGLLGALVQRGVKRNTSEHGENAARLDRLIATTGRIEERIDAHLEAHEDGTV